MQTTMWVSWGVTSLVVAAAGPFGTFGTQPFQWRLLYWGGVIALAILIGLTARTVLRELCVGRPSWVEDLGVALALGFVFGPVVFFINISIGGDAARETIGLGLTMACVLGIALCIIAARKTIEQSAAHPPEVRSDRLMARLSASSDARLCRISSDNHHVRVTTSDGEEHRLLMRLRDAVQEIDVEPGFCVHRSHWVARATIVGVTRDGARELVNLSCGSQIPVGAKYRENLVNFGVISE